MRAAAQPDRAPVTLRVDGVPCYRVAGCGQSLDLDALILRAAQAIVRTDDSVTVSVRIRLPDRDRVVCLGNDDVVIAAGGLVAALDRFRRIAGLETGELFHPD